MLFLSFTTQLYNFVSAYFLFELYSDHLRRVVELYSLLQHSDAGLKATWYCYMRLLYV